MPRPHIQRLARAALEDTAYGAELVAEARLIVEEWRREGFFGKAAQGVAGAQDKEKSGDAILTGHTLRQSVTTSSQASEVSQ